MADEEVTPPEAPVAEEKTTEKESDTFSRQYVEDLRKENATYRTRAAKFEKTFEAFDADQQDAWLSLVDNFSKDPKAAAAEMRDVAAEILKEQEEEGVEKTDPNYISKKDVEAMLKDQMTQLEVAREQAAIESQALTLGYTPNSEDLDTRLEYEDLIRVAMTLEGYDLVKADEILKARDQKKIDAWLERKKTDAGKTPKAPVAGGAAPSQEKENTRAKTFEDLEEKVMARIKATSFDN